MTHLNGRSGFVAQPSTMVTKAVLDSCIDLSFQKRFFAKVDKGLLDTDCHIWVAALSDEGYGNFTVKRHTVRAHRVAYIMAYGAPPLDRPFLDHIDCLGRFCVNPNHLEPVDNEENTRRGRGVGAWRQRELRETALKERALLRAES